jgi:hypothetical protein
LEYIAEQTIAASGNPKLVHILSWLSDYGTVGSGQVRSQLPCKYGKDFRGMPNFGMFGELMTLNVLSRLSELVPLR